MNMIQPHDLLNLCEAERGWLLETIETLVRLESPSTDKAAVDRCGHELAERLTAIAATVRRLPQTARGDHIRAEFNHGASGSPPILLLGHFDTVWPVGQLARMPFREEDGRLQGPGIFDMKSGIAVAMLAMRALATLGSADGVPPVVMLWTTDEEIGSGTSRVTIEEEARGSRAVLVLEPSLPGGAAKTSRKGCGEFHLTVHGVSAHAGLDPGKGASAIHELARQIVAVQALQDLPRGISVNVGIVSGGSRANVVADHAQAVVDARAVSRADAERVDAAIRRLRPVDPRTTIGITGGFDRPPMERSPATVRLFELARATAAELGTALGEGGAGGGSDGNFTAALGVPTLDGLGPMGDGAHALHEHVVISDLTWRAAFVAALLSRLAGVEGVK
jgi:glutamate carboxypeptidase